MATARARIASALIGATALLGALTASVAAADQTVTIQGFQFQPSSVTVQVGDTVTWANPAGEPPHTATSDTGGWDTGSIAAGASASVTFDTAGSFPYHCEFHPQMTGTVTVEAAAGGGGTPAPGGTQPPTDTQAGGDPAGPARGLLPVILLAGTGVLFLVARGRLSRPR